MAKKEKFYITTAIDYVNAEPHIGHAYQKIIADALARWHKLLGNEVFFVTGTDEHGKKIAQSAKDAEKKPKEFVDEMAKKFKNAWDLLNIEYDRFIRTTDKDHEAIVNELIDKINKSGDIYKGVYEGLYCVKCEAYYTEKDLVNGECQFHPGVKPEKLKEETYFFKLSKYCKFLLDYYKNHPEFVLPEGRRNEVINKVKEGLRDLSMTRTSIDWGIPFKLDKEHVLYVWFEALINYYTATRAKGKEKFWPADVHLLGKDNTWFHTVIWPAMLKSAGINLPISVFNHGFLTFNGLKISKSLGNSISIKNLIDKYGSDAIRYFVCREFPLAEGSDGDFSEASLVRRHNTELADKLGNLVSRVSALAEKYGIKENDKLNINIADNRPSLGQSLKDTYNQVKENMENFALDKALNKIFQLVDDCNFIVQATRLWQDADTDLKIDDGKKYVKIKREETLYLLILSIRNITILLWPFIPSTSEKIAKHFGFKISLDEINKPYKIQKIKKAEILFKKIEIKEDIKDNNISQSPTSSKDDKLINIESNKVNNAGVINMSELKFSDWEKVDLRVGKVIEAEELASSDKLIKMLVDFNNNDKRTVIAGIKKFYSIKELKNKKFVFLTNLEPRKIIGIKSGAMILAASSGDRLSLITPEKDVEVGSRLS